MLSRLLKKQPVKIGALSLGVIIVLFTIPVVANQLDHITEEFKQVKTEHDAKHTPKIEAPDEVVAGEWFDVTVTVGADALHPTMEEHYINWIAIYKNDVELARAYLHPVHTKPQVTFTIALEESATLVAMEQPNHTAPWKASKAIKVVKK
ncbi:MAG: desulfoferrodoxin family protein [Candidatus Poribacteria bacterium]|nr:desulfoferrodoxin family protein [Candidatus Poribacteria bacterium]